MQPIKMQPIIYIGFELENANSFLKSSDINEYHATNPKIHKFGDYKFLIERDGSLHARYQYITCEIISQPFKISESDKVINAIKQEVEKRTNNQNQEFNQVFEINKTMGFHTHMTFYNPITKKKISLMDWDADAEQENRDIIDWNGLFIETPKKINSHMINIFFLQKLRMLFFSNLKKSNLNENAKKSIRKNYFRKQYAKKVNIDNYTCERYSEFNLSDKDTIEWRSLNILGLKTWQELKEFFVILETSILQAFQEKTKIKIIFSEQNSTTKINLKGDTKININDYIPMLFQEQQDIKIKIYQEQEQQDIKIKICQEQEQQDIKIKICQEQEQQDIINLIEEEQQSNIIIISEE